MKRLYQHIYAAFLLSLIAFGIIAGLMWYFWLDVSEKGNYITTFSTVLELAIPATDKPVSDLKAVLLQLGDRLGVDIAIHAPNGALIASVGAPLPDPDLSLGRNNRTSAGWVSTLSLPDGRVLMIRWRRDREDLIPNFFILLGVGLIAVAIGSYPIARHLARRIEALKETVDAFGPGNLTRRVTVSGKDEVAALAASFNRAAERIWKLLTVHKTLLANASHELRSPLARLRMAVEMLETHADDPKLRKEFERNIAELDQLVDEILLASRLDAGMGAVAACDVDLLELTAEECALVGASIEGVAVKIRGDERLLRRLVRNLLDNAKRHGGGAPIEVSVMRRRDDQVVLAVCDRGPGVPDEEREKIFDPFYRPTGARESDGGVGLGLALVRQIAEKHGGRVVCLRRAGGGTCFEMSFAASVPQGALIDTIYTVNPEEEHAA